ncbi:hypothetical protein HT747_00040 [Brevibacillus borstelensis]|uniref:hypothetical protein n=1 Tax=Brevibacillus borstelensis TaxID=45462 RepID=UPI00156279E2|nr:hypothetical protein [Brevibacillus borstelensis]MBE5393589.1 hypothetical protein [Brevibacillus borstelensis]
MNSKKSPLARVVAQINAKKASQDAANQRQGTSTETANVVPPKESEQKIQEIRNLGSKPVAGEAYRPLRVRPFQAKKTEKVNDVGNQPIPTASQLSEREKIPKRQAPFEKRYRRLTTYLENGVYDKVQQLYEAREIDRISNLVNTAVKLYLMKHYNYNSKE